MHVENSVTIQPQSNQLKGKHLVAADHRVQVDHQNTTTPRQTGEFTLKLKGSLQKIKLSVFQIDHIEGEIDVLFQSVFQNGAEIFQKIKLSFFSNNENQNKVL